MTTLTLFDPGPRVRTERSRRVRNTPLPLWDAAKQDVMEFGGSSDQVSMPPEIDPPCAKDAPPRFTVEPYNKTTWGVRDGRTGAWTCRGQPKSYCQKEAERLNKEIKP